MSRKHTKTFIRGEWYNTIKNYKTRPERYLFPKDHEDIARFIVEAEKNKKTIRAVGSGHSFSNVAIVEDGNYVINTKKLDRVSPVVKCILKEEYQNDPMVWVQAGVSIKKLNEQLDTLGFSIMNMGGIDHQTISGAISTGTHGTGLNVPSVHGMVKAIQLVTLRGEKIQIETCEGISKDDLYINGDFTIIKDDDLFNAALVSLGAMGIIYAYILRAEHEYWLKEVNTIVPWSELESQLKEGTILKQYRGVKIIINPYADLNKDHLQDHTAVISTHSILYKPHKIKFTDQFRNLISSIFSNWKLIRALGFITLQYCSKKYPEKMPNIIEVALKNQKDRGYINTAHKVLYQGGDYLKERAYDCEVAFDMKDNTYIDVIDALIKNAKTLKEKGHYHTAPFAIRFVKKSNALISAEYNRDVCYIDTAMILGSKSEKEVIYSSLQLMLEMGGTPHWGKINDVLRQDKYDLEKIYPGLKKWKDIVKDYNPNGTFTSTLMKDVIYKT
ncbi:FAD-binding protein [Aquimarina sediminis]|uniref:FAD-binding protein n=1 Tax=Aquimarina sediminis TaxID=2070536 RepID=UPI000CA06AB8|nr:FAD-binding protein [Aquimarina sediminis]